MIKSLQISGIRSFSPNSEITLNFDEKLTLIIGDNGSGKSTIVESLKVATTGIFPPGSDNGRCFIHDPKFHSKPDITGTIRLNFSSPELKDYKISRSFYLNRKSDKLELKKTENLISFIEPDGKEYEKSVRVNEIDSLVPELLGLSPAILQYVCFCHQDEGLWPFSDSSTLKKVFDQIFDTEEYSKVYESMKKFIKVKKGKLKEKKDQLVWIMKQVKEDQEIIENTKKCRFEIEKVRELIEENKNLKILKQAEFKEMKEKEKIFIEIAKKKEEIVKYESFIKDLGNCEFTEEVQVDKNWEVMGKEKIFMLEKEKGLVEGEIAVEECKLREYQQEKAAVNAQVLVLESKKVQNEKIRENILLGIQDAQVIEETKEIFIKVKEKLKQEKEEMNRLLSSLKNEIIQKEVEKEKVSNELETFKQKLSQLPTDIEIKKEIEFSMQYIASSDELIENHKKTIKAIEETIRVEGNNSKISEEIHEANKIQREKISRLNEILIFLTKMSENIPGLKHLPLHEYESQIKLYSMTVESEKIEMISYKNEIETLIIQLNKENQVNLTHIQEFRGLEESLTRELISGANDMKLGFNDLPQLETLVQGEVSKLKEPDEEEEVYLKVVKKLMSQSLISKKCELCQSLIEEKSFNEKLEKTSKKLQKLKNTNEQSTVKKLKFLTLIEIFSHLKETRVKISSLESRDSQISEEIKKKSQTLDQILKNLSSSNEKSYEIITSLSSLSKHLEFLSNSLKLSLNLKLPDLQLTNFPIQNTPYKDSKKKTENLEQMLLDNETELQGLITQKQNYQLRVQELEHKFNSIQQEKSQINVSINSIEEKLQAFDPYIKELHNQYHLVMKEYPDSIKTLQDSKDKLKQSLESHKTLSALTNENKSISTQLSSLVQLEHSTNEKSQETIKKIESLHKTLEKLIQKTNEANENLLKIKSSIQSQQNLKLSQDLQQKIQILSQEIFSLSCKSTSFNPDHLTSLEKSCIEIEVNLGKHEQTYLLKSQQLKSLESKCAKPESSAISLYCEVEALELGISEYSTIMTSLETSIINYHKSKIHEVNQIISKLWAETYKGNDIEKILISADIDKSSKKSSFSYRIVFFSKGQEVDMRGRCSSGQRMMASLVIRIALAQAFSGYFTMIALDEPTTNMDAHNAEGLAECIAQLSAQFERLQLIIITHDMDFMRKIIRESPRESYLLIRKQKHLSSIVQVKCNN